MAVLSGLAAGSPAAPDGTAFVAQDALALSLIFMAATIWLVRRRAA